MFTKYIYLNLNNIIKSEYLFKSKFNYLSLQCGRLVIDTNLFKLSGQEAVIYEANWRMKDLRKEARMDGEGGR